MISKRRLILKRLTTHLEAVTFEYKGQQSLAGKVFRGRLTFGDEVKEPFVAIIEKPRQLLGEVAGEDKVVRNDDWDLLIQGFAQDDKKNPLDPAYEMLAGIEQRMSRLLAQESSGIGPMYPQEHLLGMKGIVTRIGFTIPIVRPPDNDVSDTAYFYMPVSIGIKTDMAMPYTEETYDGSR